MYDADAKLARINLALIILIVALWAYVIITPFIPQFRFWTDRFAGQGDKLARSLADPAILLKSTQSNQLIAPRMLLSAPIMESSDPNTLSQHVWRLPDSSTPDKGGNTVLVSSRFSYSQPQGVFYYLDKLRPGDEFAIVWSGKLYRYHVTNSATISGSWDGPFDKTHQSTVTLYSAAPLWFQAQRLAVTGQLVGAP